MKVITVGRSSDNDIVINDAKVSRTHLQIVQNDGGVCSVVDLNSANGTYVNGQKISSEVRLQPHDVIRIGNTTLPWQEYIKSSSIGEQKLNNPVAPPTINHNRLWLWVTIYTVIVLSGGIGLYVYHNSKEKQKQESLIQTYEANEERLRQEAEQLKSKRAQDKVDDELFRQALRADRDNNQELATAKQKEADEAKKQAKAEAAARRKAEAAKNAAEKAKTDAEKAKEAAVQNSKEAIQNAEENANKAISAANTERDSANEKAKLTEKFYEEYSVMKLDFAKQVCTQLQQDLSKNKGDAKTILKDLFNKSDNKGKQAIVDAIQVVKQQNSKTKNNEPEIKSDSLKSSKEKEVADDQMAVEADE